MSYTSTMTALNLAYLQSRLIELARHFVSAYEHDIPFLIKVVNSDISPKMPELREAIKNMLTTNLFDGFNEVDLEDVREKMVSMEWRHCPNIELPKEISDRDTTVNLLDALGICNTFTAAILTHGSIDRRQVQKDFDTLLAIVVSIEIEIHHLTH